MHTGEICGTVQLTLRDRPVEKKMLICLFSLPLKRATFHPAIHPINK